MPTKIEWVRNPDGTQGETLNPFRARDLVTGRLGHMCSKISPGCKNCYSSKIQTNGLFKIHGHEFVEENRAKVELFIDERTLTAPLRRRKPTTYFPFDMTDLFWEAYPDEWLDRFFAVAALTPQHRYMVPTKRAKRMREYWSDQDRWEAIRRAGATIPRMKPEWILPLPNVWLGVSCESQQYADERIPHLLATPAAVRFVSAEPLLGPIDGLETGRGYLSGEAHDNAPYCGQKLDWVIVGGESGPGARPFDIAWARSIIAQCKAAGVACFVKQLGANPWCDGGGKRWPLELADKKGGDPEEWLPELRVRELPELLRHAGV